MTEMMKLSGEGAQLERQLGRAEMITKISGSVVHSFNNILSGLLIRVELMLDQVETGHVDLPELRTGLLSVQKGTLDAAELLQRFREMARPSTDPAFSVFDLNAAARDVLDFIEAHVAVLSQTRRINVRLIPRLSAEPILISGQPTALREVMVNLILNSIDAMPGGGDIRVETGTEAGRAVLRVADTGIGMSAEVLSRAFTPFFTTKGMSSTGLGLSWAKDLVARHGGTISAESETGNGATFTITLPSAESATHPVAASSPASPAAPSVLVAEDEADFAEVIKEYLEAKGWRVAVADGGPAAVSEIERQLYDVVLTDLGLPGASGWDVARAARRHSPRTAVILMSGQLPSELSSDGVASVDAVLTKPIDLAQLLSVMTDLTARRSGDR